MNDKQMLQLAAKAAAHKIVIWNPLQRHGDRYRLASAAKLTIDFNIGVARSEDSNEFFTVGDESSEAYAIVRAAAEIGMNMCSPEELAEIMKE